MTANHLRTDRQDGFTLVEILVAVAITAVIMTSVAGAFLGILQARQEVHALSDSSSGGPRIMALLERDLRGLWHHNIKDNRVFLGRDRDVASRAADRINFLTTTDAIAGVDDGAGKLAKPSLCEVGYWLKENPRYPDDLLELWRREDPMVDDNLETGGTFQLVHDRIRSFSITYFDTLGAKAEPLHEWDSTLQSELPRRIKIEFTIERNLPNRNRVSGAEIGEFDETLQKYTRHIVLDQRYPQILKGGVAMVPVLPRRPSADEEGPVGGGGGGPGAVQSVDVGQGPTAFQGGRTEQRGPVTVTSSDGAVSPGAAPPPPKPPINLWELLGGGGSNPGGLFPF